MDALRQQKLAAESKVLARNNLVKNLKLKEDKLKSMDRVIAEAKVTH